MISTVLALWTALAPAPAQDTARFRQGVDYRIEARLDEGSDVLHGRTRLRYTNRSPAALDTLWFHQHLNAFRPNSAWARRELELGERRFQDLGPGEHAFERLTSARVGDRAVRPVYPGAPDSTVVAIPLPEALRPGESVTLLLDWDARLSTLPRRQGRRDRHFDFAQWYPRIAVYGRDGWQVQPLLPQGEFFGEFASFDVTLDVPEDQVIGATGVPVEGEPGWRAAAAPGTQDIAYQRDFYPERPAEPLGMLEGAAEAGRKRVRWRAEDVHHFGWSTSPHFRYEQGRAERAEVPETPIAIHVLFQPGDTAWDDGVVVRRTRDVLLWLQDLFGPYPWPQITNLHRIESGGTEFPMVVMNGSPSEGLIAHEVTHQYLHGILANNEWKAGYLDEGFTSFVDTWYFEDQGRTGLWEDAMEAIRQLERRGLAQPIATPGAEFRDPRIYGAMTYTKASLVFRMLRELVGPDTMRAILREFYANNALRHVAEEDLLRAAEDVSGQELDWFFRQWFHTTDQLDYAISGATAERLPDGRWRSRVEVVRRGEAWMPVRLQVDGESLTLTSREPRQTVEIVTTERPRQAVLDPEQVLLDLDPRNNRRSFEF